MSLNITIIGLGEVGSTLCNLLLSRKDTRINVIDPAAIQGRILDLNHAAAIYNNQVVWNEFDETKKADVVFYTAGYSNKANESRNTVAAKNKSLIKDVFSKLELNDDCLIVSVSNPVELTSKWISEVCDNVVIGTGTSLESYRFKYLLNKEHITPLEISEHMVVGEHGKRMVPLWNTEINEEMTKRIEDQVVSSAFDIRQTESATKYGVSHCCVDILNRYYSDEETLLPVSFCIDNALKSTLNIKEDIFLSIPCYLGKQKVTPVYNFSYSSNDLKRLKEAANKIESLYLKHI